jgi:hypothetical protein
MKNLPYIKTAVHYILSLCRNNSPSPTPTDLLGFYMRALVSNKKESVLFIGNIIIIECHIP